MPSTLTKLLDDISKLDAERAERAAKVSQLYSDGDQDGANRESGYVSALENRLSELHLEAARLSGELDDRAKEEASRNATDLKAIDGKASEPRKTMTELLLGPRDQFKGIGKEQAKVGISADVSGALDLPTPEVIEQGFPTTTVPTGGFLSTIPTGTTEGNITFMQPAPKTNRLIAPHWEQGLKKPPQTLKWNMAHCNVEWFAYTFPVFIPTLLDYGQIQSVIETEMRNGYARAQRFYSTQGNNEQGIVGAFDALAGIPTFDGSQYQGANDLDKIRLAIDRVTANGGATPTHIVMHPFLKTKFDLMKTEDGSNEYLGLTVNGSIWNLPVVTDEHAVVMDAEGEEPTKYLLMIYYAPAFTWYTQHGATLSAQPVGEQFLQNMTTFRLEGSHALKIADPMKAIKIEYDIVETDKDLVRSLYVVPTPTHLGVKGYGSDGLTGSTMNVANFGAFAIDGHNLVGVADPITGYKAYSKTAEEQDGLFCALTAEPGAKVQKDSNPAKTLDDDGLVVVRLGKDKVDAKKIKFTHVDGTEDTLNVKVAVNDGKTIRKGPRVSA